MDVPADGPDMPRDDAGNDNDGVDAADKGSDNEDDANKGSDDEDKEKEQPEATKEKKKKTSRPGPDARLLAAVRLIDRSRGPGGRAGGRCGDFEVRWVRGTLCGQRLWCAWSGNARML